MRTLHTLRRSWLIGLLLVLTGPIVSGQGRPKTEGFTNATAARLQKVLTDALNDPTNRFVGGMSAAIKIEGLAFWQGAAGYASRNVDQTLMPIEGGIPFTVNTPSQIYSVTKSFTSSLVLQLVEEGKLSLTGKVSQYLPLHQINPDLADVTIHQLLAHESHYSDFWDNPYLIGSVAMNPYKIWTAAEALAFVHQDALPGKPREYSSSNYIMLGAIVENVTGIPVAKHFRDRFFTPLQLHSMYLRGQEPAPVGYPAMAAPHDDLGVYGFPLFPNAVTNISLMPFDGIASLAFTSGGIVSTVADVAEWGSALFVGRANSKFVLDALLASIDNVGDNEGDYLGYGIWKSSRMSTTETFLGHDGSAPGYRSVMFYQPEKKLTIAILSNDYGVDLYKVAKALYALVPEFPCGNVNRKEDKVLVCFQGKLQCVDRSAAPALIQKGAYLGTCEAADAAPQTVKGVNLKAHPNPVDNQAVISFTPEQSGWVSLRLFDVYGNQKAVLYEGMVEKGVLQQVVLERGSLNAGVYFVRLQTAAGTTQQKLVLNR
jgi:CubicO group peptidase (beta-lactamase class C family)